MAGVVIGVLGGCGGIGASSFAAVVAAAAAPSVLVDLDPVGAGLDVLLGIEAGPGARWSGLRLGGGRLDPASLADGLPRWREVAVLASDGGTVSPADALQVLDAAAELGPVVADLPRAPSPLRDTVARRCTVLALVVGAEVAGLAAARAVVRSLPAGALGLVVRRGSVPVGDAVRLLGGHLVGVLPALGRDPAWAGRQPRSAARVATGLLDAVSVVAR